MENAPRFSILRELFSCVGWTTFTCPPASAAGRFWPPVACRDRLVWADIYTPRLHQAPLPNPLKKPRVQVPRSPLLPCPSHHRTTRPARRLQTSTALSQVLQRSPGSPVILFAGRQKQPS